MDLNARIETAKLALPTSLRKATVLTLLQLSLAEDLSPGEDFHRIAPDLGSNDITSAATLDPDSHLSGHLIAKASGLVAGMPVAAAVFKLVHQEIALSQIVPEGTRVRNETVLAEISGPSTTLLTGERAALNFLCRLSGIASFTRKFVDEVSGTEAIILDTRKTSPGSRHLDKYAVRIGGGQNHRMGLHDMILIKDNHIVGAGGIEEAVHRVRQHHGDNYPIEVEVKSIQELEITLTLGVDRIMLDNMDVEKIRHAVSINNKRVPLEVSGNVNLQSVRSIAETGVSYISIGALTHSAPILDISLDLL